MLKESKLQNLSLSPLHTLVNLCSNASETKPIVFWIGSGISTVSPSLLPSASEMVQKTVNAILPFPINGSDVRLTSEKEEIVWVLPEIYYENIVSILGEKALDVWEVLRFWNEDEKLRRLNLGPNKAHYLIVYLAWKSRSPIITTNFDTLFEEAARRLDLIPVISLPENPEYSLTENSNEVSIWKVHGTIETGKVDSIFSTIETISKVDYSKLRQIKAQFLRSGSRICFMGYSGRDIDLFPFITEWETPGKIIWLDPVFPSWHNIYSNPNRFEPIKSTSDDFVNSTLPTIQQNDSVIRKIREIFTSSCFTGQFDPNIAKEIYQQAMNDHIEKTFSELLSEKDPCKDLIHAITLASVGLYKNTFEYVDRFLQSTKSNSGEITKLIAKAYLAKASFSHATSKYIDSHTNAATAFDISKANKLIALQQESIIAMDEALRMQHIPSLRFHDESVLYRPKTWLLFLRFSLHAWQLYRHIRLTKNYNETDSLRLRFILLEHLVRLFAIVQSMALILFSKRIVRLLMAYFWKRIADESQRIGFANGVGFAHRYAERLDIQEKSPPLLSSIPYFDFLGESTGRAIAYRDWGNRLTEKAYLLTESAARESLLLDAAKAYEKGFEIADKSGNACVALKLLICRKHFDPKFRADKNELRALLDEIQGDGYRRIEKTLIKWLCEEMA